ncbi:MAG TPA: GerMN domain-containing protein [Clostridiales bacterium]|nr:GerMN domain-containing protein [Clostridiales bacterium]
MNISRKLNILVPVIIIMLALITGCSRLLGNIPGNDNEGRTANPPQVKESPVPIDPYEQAKETRITLYFKHEIADFLVPEERTVLQEKKSTEQLIVEELLKGPQSFERVLVMPPGTEIIDVTRRSDTVFVNLTDDFLNPIDLTAIPGKEKTPEEDYAAVQAEMKRLAVYSIVNSLTYLDGVNQVKLMVNNTQLSYREMGTEILLEEGSVLNPDSPMVALHRNKNVNQTPAKTVRLVLNALTAEPDWDIIYRFLSGKTMDGSNLPPLDEFKAKVPPVVGGMIAFEGSPVIEEEYLVNKAFVTVQYTDKTSEPAKEVNEVLTVDYIDGIWKLRLPSIFSQYK